MRLSSGPWCHCSLIFVCGLKKDQFRTQWCGQPDSHACPHKFAPGGLAVRRAAILKMQPVSPAGLQALKDESMLILIGNAAAECIDHPFPAFGAPILHAVPMHTVRTRRDVVETSVPNQRTQLHFVESNGL